MTDLMVQSIMTTTKAAATNASAQSLILTKESHWQSQDSSEPQSEQPQLPQ
jgi:hypothetical protein